MAASAGESSPTFPRTEFVSSTPPETYATDQLRLEIELAGLSVSLLPEPDTYDCTFTSITVNFSGPLTAGDAAKLNGLVAVHTGKGLASIDNNGPVVEHAPTGAEVIAFEDAGTVVIDMSAVPAPDIVEYDVDAALATEGSNQIVIVSGIALGAIFRLKATNGFLNAIPVGGTLPLSSAMYSMIRVPGGWRIGLSPLP